MLNRRAHRVVILGLVLALATGCSEGERAGTGGAGGAAGSGPSGIELLPPGWSPIGPGGRTMCARGDPWMFFVRPATVNRLVVEYEGGGACWDAATCAPGDPTFVDWLRFPAAMY